MLNVAAQNQLVAYFEQIREAVKEFESVMRLFLFFW